MREKFPQETRGRAGTGKKEKKIVQGAAVQKRETMHFQPAAKETGKIGVVFLYDLFGEGKGKQSQDG